MKKLSRNVKILVVLLLVFVFCDFLISPVVFETRASALLGNSSSLRWLVVLFLGLFLNIASIILLFIKPRVASVIAIIGSILYLIVTISDQLGLVTPLKAPVLVSIVEVITAVVLIGVFIFASMVYRENPRKPSSGVMPVSKATTENK
ncbi:MAG: hypothetical protein OK457_04255 [Thaumarchaeota archaeon]|nr:hypothetical protein [Nitrososphaerota archaeon]